MTPPTLPLARTFAVEILGYDLEQGRLRARSLDPSPKDQVFEVSLPPPASALHAWAPPGRMDATMAERLPAGATAILEDCMPGLAKGFQDTEHLVARQVSVTTGTRLQALVTLGVDGPRVFDEQAVRLDDDAALTARLGLSENASEQERADGFLLRASVRKGDDYQVMNCSNEIEFTDTFTSPSGHRVARRDFRETRDEYIDFMRSKHPGEEWLLEALPYVKHARTATPDAWDLASLNELNRELGGVSHHAIGFEAEHMPVRMATYKSAEPGYLAFPALLAFSDHPSQASARPSVSQLYAQGAPTIVAVAVRTFDGTTPTLLPELERRWPVFWECPELGSWRARRKPAEAVVDSNPRPAGLTQNRGRCGRDVPG